MDMPYNLQTLPAEALDILRYYGQLEADSAHTDAIIDSTGLSDRSFGKGIRRLVTKNYLVMSADQVYRLSDSGRRVVEELRSYEGSSQSSTPARSTAEARFLRRRLVLVAPRALPVDQPVEVTLGFEEADTAEYLNAPANMLLRLAVINGEPHRPSETTLALTNEAMHQPFEVSAGHFTAARLRVEVCQARDDSDDFEFCGGMYVDLPIKAGADESTVAAYGIDVILKEEA